MADALTPARPRRAPRGPAWAHRLFVAPSVLALVVLGLYPLLFIAGAAFTDSSLGRPFQEWVGTETIEKVLGDADAVATLGRTLVYALGVSAASLALGVVAALALHGAVRSGSFVRTLLLLPLITPPVIVGTLWKLVYNPGGGLLATVLGFFGAPRDAIAPLSSTTWALPGIALADVWEWTPLVALLVFTALLAQDAQTLEAARLDGAHGFALFRYITLPAISGVVAAAFFVRLVLAFKVFDLVFMMTSGGPGQATTTTSYLIYQAALREFDLGKAAVITLLLAVLVTVATLPFALVARRLQVNHE
ncbi:carbohydrate ABC transporter permease [Microbacterium sp. Clip185]|uniref:carbohydrate ABC transporter permease n=1 Tax=Microbacterium sp. Clip185 TaxID=3025663 RepID=UPI002365F2DE|nr:sugar ABC transporter permease [Microbacterium sp. Clip185]WDG18879.1 sugar ABC transporter permease [Microbacterium sp. Clip185]